MRQRLRGIAIASVSVFTVGIVVAAPAHATTEWDYCSPSNDNDGLTSGINWSSYGTSSYDVGYVDLTITGNTASENNLYAQIRAGDHSPVYFSWYYGGADGEETYRRDVDQAIPRSVDPEFWSKAIFDQNGPDPSCTNLIDIG